MNTDHCFRNRSDIRQSGQALVEAILACSLLTLFLFATMWVGKFGELKQYNTEAVRFAAWERTVYHMHSGDERKSLYASDDQIAAETFRYTYLTPEGQRGTEGGGGGNIIGSHQSWGSVAAHFFSGWLAAGNFNDVINTALKVQTTAEGVPGNAPNGFDPTGNTLTNLKLDQVPYDTVSLTATISLADFFKNFFERRLGIIAPTVAPVNQTVIGNLGHLALVTNSWAAPGSVAISRVYGELNPLSKTNYIGHYVVNNPTAFNLSQFYGGQAGFAGNYRVDKIGLSGADASTLFNNALSGQFSHNSGDWLALFKPTNAYSETLGVAPEGSMRFEPDYAGLLCKTRVAEAIRLTSYTQDARCPKETTRARTISFFDNPAWRFSTMDK